MAFFAATLENSSLTVDPSPIEKSVRESAVVHIDETGSRVAGDNWWEWVFWTTQAVLNVIRFNRSVDVIKDVMDTVFFWTGHRTRR